MGAWGAIRQGLLRLSALHDQAEAPPAARRFSRISPRLGRRWPGVGPEADFFVLSWWPHSAASTQLPPDKVSMNSPTCRKMMENKSSPMSSSPPTSLETNGTGMRSERNQASITPCIHLPTSEPFSGPAGGTRAAVKQEEVRGWPLPLGLDSLCRAPGAHNRAQQTEQPTASGPAPTLSRPFANANGMATSCPLGTQKGGAGPGGRGCGQRVASTHQEPGPIIPFMAGRK